MDGYGGGGFDHDEWRKRITINSELRAIKKSHNPGANGAVYEKVQRHLASEGRSYNADSLRSMMAFLAQVPDATCTFGKRASGYRSPAYATSTSGYGINCASPSKGKKGRMFFSGLPTAVIDSLAAQQSHHVPDALMARYMKSNQDTLKARSSETASTQQTAFEPVAVKPAATTDLPAAAAAEPAKPVAVNPFPTYDPNTLVDTPSSTANPVTQSAF